MINKDEAITTTMPEVVDSINKAIRLFKNIGTPHDSIFTTREIFSEIRKQLPPPGNTVPVPFSGIPIFVFDTPGEATAQALAEKHIRGRNPLLLIQEGTI
jgi:hypothetical protein